MGLGYLDLQLVLFDTMLALSFLKSKKPFRIAPKQLQNQNYLINSIERC